MMINKMSLGTNMFYAMVVVLNCIKLNVTLQPIHYEEKKWVEEEWSKGRCISSMPPGVMTKYGRLDIKEHRNRTGFESSKLATLSNHCLRI